MKKSKADGPAGGGSTRPSPTGRTVSWRDLAEAAERARRAAEKRLGR